MKKKLIYLLLSLVCLGSCERPSVPGEQEDAVFFFKGVIGGNLVEISAGDHSYFMRTSFSEDTLNIRSFTGELGNRECVGKDQCPGQLQISIRERKVENGLHPSVDECLKVQSYFFRGPPEYLFTSYKATFSSRSTPIGINHLWDFGDGSIPSTLLNPVHYYVNEADSIVNPSLVVSSGGGCSSVISFPINFTSGCKVDFNVSYNSAIGRLTWTFIPGVGRTELWDFGNGYMIEGPNNLPPTDSVFTSCLESTDAFGCISYKCKNVVLDTQKVDCVSNFDVSTEIVVTEDVRDYSEVTVNWNNQSGKKYSSTKFQQPENSSFRIISVEDYITDQNNNSTKRITVQFDVRLFGDSESDYLDVVTEKSIFAIAYP